ncbi:MAG TPA: DUF937 domain-containing protein [Candidatus Limnocylindria bacterium]|jgi:hypothetical protein|nr:DUF937 domain-containing protein [Candidatus Limnocylindria bacterium]
MAELSDTLNQLLSGQTEQISQRIGADGATTSNAIQAAVPSLLAALSQEADKGEGLQQALEKDHDGSILDNLAGYLGGTAQLSPRTTNGAGILNHVLGDKQDTLARGISAKSGLDIGSVANLLTLLAPIVMGMLGKKQSSGAGGGLGDILNREKADAQGQGGLGDILGSILGSGGTTKSGGIGDILGGLLGGKK